MPSDAPAEPTPTDRSVSYAEVAADGDYDWIPGEGWWTFTATPGSYDDERSLEHPDTILVAGWDDAVIEGYDRDLSTGAITIVPGTEVEPVPVSTGWPDEWLILDAETFDVVDSFPVGAVPDAEE